MSTRQLIYYASTRWLFIPVFLGLKRREHVYNSTVLDDFVKFQRASTYPGKTIKDFWKYPGNVIRGFGQNYYCHGGLRPIS